MSKRLENDAEFGNSGRTGPDLLRNCLLPFIALMGIAGAVIAILYLIFG
jgi:hypothetical protein